MSQTERIVNERRTPMGRKVYVWHDGALVDVEKIPLAEFLIPPPLPEEVTKLIQEMEEAAQRISGLK